MKEDRQEKLKISNDFFDNILVGVKTQEDLRGKDGIITRLNKALLECFFNAEMDFHLIIPTKDVLRATQGTATARKLSRAT